MHDLEDLQQLARHNNLLYSAKSWRNNGAWSFGLAEGFSCKKPVEFFFA